ncbi:MAG: single-strand DNA-binding protein [Bryobacterales bacterium]|jgi:single-strand DNA-binding protein|nr:single-strand DNA-binding protein [Bryobacterales bacterium]
MYSNRVMITGFLGNDPESRTTRNSSTFTALSVATKRNWKNREPASTSRRRHATDVSCTWPTAAFAATLLKGAHVQIEGELRTREYAQRASGQKACH